MSGILLPQVVLYNSLRAIVKLLRDDLRANAADDTKTILYRILGVGEDGNRIIMAGYDYFRQAKQIILTPNNLNVHLGYIPETAHQISLHIILPSETADPACLGEDQGYITDDDFDGADPSERNTYTQTYNTTYQVMITSDNSKEVDVVYSILKSMLVMIAPNLDVMGLRIPTFSGNDIIMQQNITPVPLFHKVINISFKYELTVPQLFVQKVMKNFHYIMRMVDYNDEA